MAKKKDETKNKSIKVSKDLKDFDIQINSLGEIIANYDVDKINEFLNKNTDDKKLRKRKKEEDEASDENTENTEA